ncbi:MAG: hypothetical protein AB7N24_23200, partial [Dehalococcoidia bacterium]
DTVAEYALRGTTQPMAVSQYELTKALPENLKDKLPSVEELEAEFEGDQFPGSEGEGGRHATSSTED